MQRFIRTLNMLSVAYRSIVSSLLPGLKASVIMDYESRRETKPFRALKGDFLHSESISGKRINKFLKKENINCYVHIINCVGTIITYCGFVQATRLYMCSFNNRNRKLQIKTQKYLLEKLLL